MEQIKFSMRKKCGVSKCRQQGGLFGPRVPFIQSIHHVKYCPAGGCLLNGLSHNPHYQITGQQEEVFISRAASCGIPIEYYGLLDDWKCTNGVVFADMTAESNEHLSEIFSRLDFESDLISFLSGDGIWRGDPLRTTMQCHYGYTGGHSLSRDNPERLPRPQLINGEVPEEVAEEMAVLSELTDALYNDDRCKEFRGKNNNTVFGDRVRAQMFSNKIHPDNSIESITKQVQSPDNLCRTHIDISNDGTDFGQLHNYDVTAIYWKIFDLNNYVLDPSHPFYGKVARVAKLCYSRRSVIECMNRENACDRYIDGVFIPWFEKLPECRKNEFPDERMFSRKYVEGAVLRDHPQHLILKPCLNKSAAFYSAFVDAYDKVRLQ